MVDDGRTDGRRTDDGAWVYTISSLCEPDGSGELKICIALHTPVLLCKRGSRGYTLHGHVFLMFKDRTLCLIISSRDH